MANLSVILAHPRHGSFNHAIATTAVQALELQGHEVWFHDLYQENFDPVFLAPERERQAYLPPFLEQHCREIAKAQGIVIVHPNWWGQPPAILKGWVDRVLRPGVAYRFLEGDQGDGVPVGLLQAKAALGVHHLQHPPGAGTGSLRRPPGNALEKLHFWVVRRPDGYAPEFRRGGDQHPRPTAGLA